jgi:metal-sulfur cluster biosynthetic enzyme
MRAQLAEALDDSAIGVSLVARLYDTVVGDLMALPDESAVLDALREVDDPEAGMNIVDLGLVYAVRVGDDRIDVDMTMTTPACPVTETLVAQAQAAIAAISPPATMVEVHLVWEPIWNPSMMSGTARDFFGWDK